MMILIKDEYIIVSAQCVENLFILNIVRKNVIMTVQSSSQQVQQ